MRKLILSTMILIVSYVSFSQDNIARVSNFHKFIGNEKSTLLKETIKYLDEFLVLNFSSYKTEEEKVQQFLKLLESKGYKSSQNKLKFDLEKNKLLTNKFEKTGLRKDIWVYGKELISVDSLLFLYVNKFVKQNNIKYEIRERGYTFTDEVIVPLNMDTKSKEELARKKKEYNNSIILRDFSLIMYGFDIFPSQNSFIQEYKEIKFNQGSEGQIRKVLHDKIKSFDKKSFQDPYFKIILVIDFFYPCMLENN